MKHKRMLAALLLAVLLEMTAACATPAPQQTDAAGDAANTQQTQTSQEPLEPTPEPNRQEGSLDCTLLSGADLSVVATGYTFTQNDRITVRVQVNNDNGNPGSVWLLLTGINGWDVRSRQQSTTIVTMQPGEQKEQEIVFDLSADTERYLKIDALQTLEIAAEGYIDSSDYEYTMSEHQIEIPDAPTAYVQTYTEGMQVLLDDDVMTIALCGQDADTGAMTLYLEVKTPQPGGSCKLYPVENGVFDSEKYLVLDELDLSTATRKLFSFTPVQSGMPEAFYAVFSGVALAPQKLTVNTEEILPAELLQSMAVIAENEWIRIYYDAAGHRFYAENRTEDQMLQLDGTESFTLDGRQVRANPQTVLCFPRCATAFRASGRAADEKGTQRNVTIGADNRSLSIGWNVSGYLDGLNPAAFMETMQAENVTLP